MTEKEGAIKLAEQNLAQQKLALQKLQKQLLAETATQKRADQVTSPFAEAIRRLLVKLLTQLNQS